MLDLIAPSAARFITFEGGEGVGKSTQVKRLLTRLNRNSIAAIRTREPGGTPKAGGRGPKRCCSPPLGSTTSTS